MENYGLIIRHLRHLAGMGVRETARKIGRSIGWLSEIENNCGTARLTDTEFNRIIEILDGTKHKPMFKTWVSTYKMLEGSVRPFDGAVLKFIRSKKEMSLATAATTMGFSLSYLSKIENGIKPMTLKMRDKIMSAYGYNPSSFRNFSRDPVRSKVVPISYKLEILLKRATAAEIEKIFNFAQMCTGTQAQDTLGNEKNNSNQGE